MSCSTTELKRHYIDGKQLTSTSIILRKRLGILILRFAQNPRQADKAQADDKETLANQLPVDDQRIYELLPVRSRSIGWPTRSPSKDWSKVVLGGNTLTISR